MNILIEFLNLLSVKHTTLFANKLYNEHPYRDSFYGISKMLLEYKIKNIGLQNQDKDSINEYEAPFLTQQGHEFVMVKQLTNEKITFYWKDQYITIPITRFQENWTGAVLLPEVTEQSIEPDYKKHLKEEMLTKGVVFALISFLFILFFSAVKNNQLFESAKFWSFLCINLIGLYATSLLLKKELNISDRYGDKICSLFKKANCNSILESEASQLFGFFKWSEIGFSYFVTNLIVISFTPSLYLYLAIINVLALPYTFWSVWYQANKAKTWCPLCLLTIASLWGIFIVSIFSKSLDSVSSLFVLLNSLQTLSLYAISFLCTTLLIPIIKNSRGLSTVAQRMNYIKGKDEVFEAVLKKQTYYEVSDNDSKIIFGKASAKIRITVLTNPHCVPCGSMHKRLKRLSEKKNGDICWQYIFSAFNGELENSSVFLISTYLNNRENAESIFDEWFEKGKQRRDDFYKKYSTPIAEKEEEEHKKHLEWKNKNKMSATPTVLINGYLLPSEYMIEDLEFITDLNF